MEVTALREPRPDGNAPKRNADKRARPLPRAIEDDEEPKPKSAPNASADTATPHIDILA
jgi:hypothetical protein